MSRRIVGYLDGKAVWEDLGPAENVQWGRSIGGSAIQPAVLHRGEPSSVKHLKQKLNRLRGAALFDPETGAWKK